MESIEWTDAELHGFYERDYDFVPEPEQFQRMPLPELLFREAHSEKGSKRQRAFIAEVAFRTALWRGGQGF